LAVVEERRLTESPNKKAESATEVHEEDDDGQEQPEKLIQTSRGTHLAGKIRTVAFLA
jgi:hypothetical protein